MGTDCQRRPSFIQVAEIKHAIRGDVLVHVFSNNGMYLLQHLLRTMPQDTVGGNNVDLRICAHRTVVSIQSQAGFWATVTLLQDSQVTKK